MSIQKRIGYSWKSRIGYETCFLKYIFKKKKIKIREL